MLSVRNLQARYGALAVLFGVDFDLAEAGTLALIGANGAGKSTAFGVICGLTPATAGEVLFAGKSLLGQSAEEIVRDGLVLVPEGRCLFASLSVEENLLIGSYCGRKGPWNLSRIYEAFPSLLELRARPSYALSGGQQQLVAVGRALMANPAVLLCDELSLGLSPLAVQAVYAGLQKVKREGVSIILVEQDIARALAESDRFVCMRHGRAVMSGSSRDADRAEISDAYFGARPHD
jgi:branched-chain amino acid transport system ATP-binding protein